MAVVFGLAVATGPLATAGYRRRYGSVVQWGRTRRHQLIVAAVVTFVALAHVDMQVRLPVALGPLWIGAVLIVVVWADGWIRAHFLLGAMPWLLVARVPALHAEPRLAAYGSQAGCRCWCARSAITG